MTIHKPANAMNNAHIGSSSASLKACVNWFARLTYSLTIVPVKQKGAVFVSSILVSTFLLSGSASARDIVASDFFNFEYAKSLWVNLKERAPMKELYDCHKRDGGVFDRWEDKLRGNTAQALKALETHPHADDIKQCYDTHLTFEVWDAMYDAWRDPLVVYGSEGWNKNTRGLSCMVIKSLNIFTGQCNDMPDWRHPNNAKEDAAWMAKGNARWLKKKK